MNYFQAASCLYASAGGLIKPSQARSRLSTNGGNFLLYSADGEKLAEYRVASDLLPLIRNKGAEKLACKEGTNESPPPEASTSHEIITTSTVYTDSRYRRDNKAPTSTNESKSDRFKPAFPFFVIFAVIGILFPPALVLAAISGMVWLYPRILVGVAKWVALGLLGIVGLSIILASTNLLQPSTNKKSVSPLSSSGDQPSEAQSGSGTTEPEASETVLTHSRGKAISDRLEAECDYWGIDEYLPGGRVKVSKAIFTTWGGKDVMMIPRGSWNSLSSQDKNDLVEYVSSRRGVSEVYVGTVRPSEKYDGNTITVDESVWP